MKNQRETELEKEKIEKEAGPLFQPDTILSEQYFDSLRKKAQLDPERALMFAVLEDAIACFQDYLPAREKRGQALFHEAEEWIWEKNGDWPFSFENICESLDLNPDYVRKGLLCWKEKRLAAKAKVYPLKPQEKREAPGAQEEKEAPPELRQAAGG